MKMKPVFLILLTLNLGFSVCSFGKQPFLPDTLSCKFNQIDHFSGYLELPATSLTYALSDISDSTAQTFIQYGLAQIYYHPDRAKLYSQKLQAFLHTHPLVADEPTASANGYLYGGYLPHSRTARLPLFDPVPTEVPKQGIDRLLDLLPSLNFFVTLWGLFSLCCTLVVVILTTVYLIARKNGTTFTLILNHNGQITYL